MIPSPDLSAASAAHSSLPRPSRARHTVLLFAVTLAVITYIDRICISQAKPDIMRDLKLNDIQMGYVFGAFFWAYALFEIPGGLLGDKIGPRKVLTRVVLLWSFFTAATGWAWNYASLLFMRFWFGAGEAGCFPNLTKVFTTWLPTEERTRAQGIMWMSARWGGAFTPLLVVWVLSLMSWQYTFLLFGLLGIVWAAIFWWWYRDKPSQHPSVNAAELNLLKDAERNASQEGNVPWGTFLTNRSVWLLSMQYFCLAYGWHFYITWLPTYLQEARGLSLGRSAFLAGFPLFFGGIACLFGGLIARRLSVRMGSTAKARRTLAYIGFVGSALMLILSTKIQDPTLAMVSMGLASFSNDLTMPGSWSACMDVGGRLAGTLSGMMNMMASFAGAIAPIVIGYVLHYSERNWLLAFWISASMYLIGAICWRFIDPVTPLEYKEQ